MIVTDLTKIASYINQNIHLVGFLYNARYMKKMTFLILRRNHIYLQCIIDKAIETIALESIISIYGTVVKRSDNNINTHELLGQYEIKVKSFSIQKLMHNLPFAIMKSHENSIELRERYRYLDLRNNNSFAYIKLFSQLLYESRKYFHANNYIEINTPILTSKTDDGASNYIVICKRFTKQQYALAQSPQVYKQILMCADIERYFQISPCFRDEESRSNRLTTEFTQLDVEHKADNIEHIIKTCVDYIIYILRVLLNKELVVETIEYDDVMKMYGTDQYDRRTWLKFNISIVDNHLHFDNIDNVFHLLRSSFDDIALKQNICYIHKQSSQLNAVLMKLSFIYNQQYNQSNEHYMLVVKHYPYFDTDQLGNQVFRHNPFSKTYIKNGICYALQYDCILDSQEIAGGSIRENDEVKLKEYIQDKNLIHFIEMYKHGTMMHGGFAVGLERLLYSLLSVDIINFVPFFTLKNGCSSLPIAPS